ncbi:DUF2514 family protein [Pseudomonas fluorescens]|uniref:DUF2514 domain-containing protein n=1 Tax=Pseudomonas fluorescens TaxID=294 RepID=A0A5E6RFJ5_PSEFL|nr:DUF2514 family protein [Pseudomonas fluorescens]VVM66936.1 hypothetical protein PS652_01573 [Pseudomonas fluorescens]
MISSRTVGAAVSLALVASAFWGAYEHGRSTMDAEWQARWAVRDAGDQHAWALAEAAEREKEQARQQSMNKVIQDGQKIIDEALADAAAARAANGSLRDTAEDLARRLAAQARNHSCTAATSQTAARVAMVFADVFERADERAGDLAAVADQSRGRGVMCEQAYLSLGER